eukprot:GHUV01004262.1.p1 GENE.GHUV01004262.1~~GHUV01004262.1.p1  ORF type:complete len:109 (+),score=14.79 GHUV01004262.1:185-511(+)
MYGLVSPHRQRAVHLYRRALKTCLDWSGSRQQWYARARAIRAEFEANRHIDNREAAERMLTHGEQLLQEWKHPDPIVPPYYVGGTAFSRNPPMPKEVKIVLNFGREDH